MEADPGKAEQRKDCKLHSDMSRITKPIFV